MSRWFSHPLEKTALTLISAVLYVGFYKFNGWIFSIFEYSNGVSWVFLPAGFRVILVLALGFSGAAGLVLGSYYIDREVVGDASMSLAFLNGLASGVIPWLVMKFLHHRHWLSHHMPSLTARQLLHLTLIFSAASAISHQLVWWWMGRPNINVWLDVWPMFVGNALGALLMLYCFKFVLDRWSARA